jgi:hypothetical protein
MFECIYPCKRLKFSAHVTEGMSLSLSVKVLTSVAHQHIVNTHNSSAHFHNPYFFLASHHFSCQDLYIKITVLCSCVTGTHR